MRKRKTLEFIGGRMIRPKPLLRYNLGRQDSRGNYLKFQLDFALLGSGELKHFLAKDWADQMRYLFNIVGDVK